MESGLLGLAGTGTDLRQEQVDAKRCILVVEKALDLGNLLAKHVWCVSAYRHQQAPAYSCRRILLLPYTTDDAKTSSVCDSRSQLGTSSDVHAGKHDGMVDLQKIGRDRADLL